MNTLDCSYLHAAEWRKPGSHLVLRARTQTAASRWQQTLLLLLFLAAGMGPLFRYGDITLARVVSVLYIFYALFTLRLTKPVFLFFGIAYGLCLFSGQDEVTVGAVFQSFLFVGYGLLAMLISEQPISEKQLRQVFIVLTFVGLAAALSAIFENVTGYNWHTRDETIVLRDLTRSRGLHGDPNATSDFILLGVVSSVFLSLSYTGSRIVRILRVTLASSIIAVCAWGLYCTVSRGSLIALFLASLPVLLSRRLPSALRLLTLISCVLVIVVRQFIFRNREFTTTADVATIGRISAWKGAWDTFIQSPLWGDLSYYRWHYLPYVSSTHNSFFEILAYGGMLSIIPWILIHWLVMRNAWNNRHILSYVFLASLFLVFVGGGLTHTTHTSVIFWALAGLCINSSFKLQASFSANRHVSSI